MDLNPFQYARPLKRPLNLVRLTVIHGRFNIKVKKKSHLSSLKRPHPREFYSLISYKYVAH